MKNKMKIITKAILIITLMMLQLTVTACGSEQTEVSSKTFAGGVENSPFLGQELSGKIIGSYIAGLWG